MQVRQSTPWFFLAPNLLIFGVFTFLPIAINFYYAFTGGVELYPKDRPFVGFDNLATLLDCGNHFDPSRPAARTCSGAPSTTPASSACCRSADGAVSAGDGAGAQPQDHRPRLLARRVLLSGAAVARWWWL
jgi:ABC-type sugar transport system permease subunit